MFSYKCGKTGFKIAMITPEGAESVIPAASTPSHHRCCDCGGKMWFDDSEAADVEYISIHVRNPRTHLVGGWPAHTDYEIVVETNSMIFAKKNSYVRRRFSEFMWLWKQMSRHTSCSMKLPSLPTKRRLFRRFRKEFLEERRDGLQRALASLARITPILADAAFHLFLQSNLTVKEMESVLSGRDTRDLIDIIAPKEEDEPRCNGKQGRKSTCHSTGDSGFSGSVKPEDFKENTGILAEVSNWVTSQQNYASSCLMGNGWSSGYTYQTTKYACPDREPPRCADCSAKRSSANRRISLSDHVASVLPGGQLRVAPAGHETESAIPEHPDDSSSGASKPYDGDDETDFTLVDYEIIKNEPLTRVRNWLKSQDRTAEDESSDEEENGQRSPGHVPVNEYDVISVPCCSKPSNNSSTQSTGYHSNNENNSEDTVVKEDDNDSVFSVVHSSIDGLDWNDRDEMSSSCDSLNSAALFLTYDVVEMIELRYNNVV